MRGFAAAAGRAWIRSARHADASETAAPPERSRDTPPACADRAPCADHRRGGRTASRADRLFRNNRTAGRDPAGRGAAQALRERLPIEPRIYEEYLDTRRFPRLAGDAEQARWDAQGHGRLTRCHRGRESRRAAGAAPSRHGALAGCADCFHGHLRGSARRPRAASAHNRGHPRVLRSGDGGFDSTWTSGGKPIPAARSSADPRRGETIRPEDNKTELSLHSEAAHRQRQRHRGHLPPTGAARHEARASPADITQAGRGGDLPARISGCPAPTWAPALSAA